MAGFRAGKRMVHGGVAVFLFVVFEHGKIDYPQRFPFIDKIAVGRAVFVSDFNPQCANRFVYHFGFVRAEENQIAVLRAGALYNGFQAAFGQEFYNRRLQAAVFAIAQIVHIVHFDVRQAFCAVNADKFGVFVNVFAAQFRAIGHAQGNHATVGHIGSGAEYFELFRFHHVC